MRRFVVLASDRLTMAMSGSFATVRQTPAAQTLLRRVELGGVLSCNGVAPSARPFLTALLCRWFPRRPVIVITENRKTQECFHEDLSTWLKFLGGETVTNGREKRMRPNNPATSVDSFRPPFFFPAWEVSPQESQLPHVDIIAERLETLVSLASGAAASDSPVVITSVAAMMQKTFTREFLRQRIRTLNRGDNIELLHLVEWLEEQHYESEAQVTQKGEIALRGGILDVYPVTSPWPLRLEFSGNELESLRYFDPTTQLSREEVTAVTLPPGGELGILSRMIEENPEDGVGRVVATLVDYLPADTLVILSDRATLEWRAQDYALQIHANDPLFDRWADVHAALVTKGMTILDLNEIADHLSAPENPSPACPLQGSDAGALLETGPVPVATELTDSSIPFSFAAMDSFRPIGGRPADPQIAEVQRREFLDQLHRWLRQGYELHVFCNNAGEQERFKEIWIESGLAGPTHDLTESALRTEQGALSGGFICEEAGLVVVTDAEIFGRYKVQRPRRLRSPHAVAVRSSLDIDFSEFDEGDYVVHVQYGIGRYLGLKVLPVVAIGRRNIPPKPLPNPEATDPGEECLVIEYAPAHPGEVAPKLYVPVTQAHLVSKYVGAGKASPPLNTLGGGRWAKTKENAEKAVRDLAGEFLAIQAARESQPGHAYPPDSVWQSEFEGAFVYEETTDQILAIRATKTDMEAPRPMDRLICGDVGFGKTEVAIRAAFKAVMGGKQVAVLVPTTVLAQQHFNTFRERMADYPMRVELLSRFRSRGEQTRVIRDLRAGAVDIVIGTHRLVQSDIAFKDLGLVVIDEEQRFGVLHKERLKRLRTLVDVLTLSATPIPRTLYMALTGARDMSTIETPPQDRLPVETFVTQYDERLIRDAIRRELNRNGQVFFLHNRVSSIRTIAERLRNLVPEARVVVGHGQMPSEELEEVMTRFVSGEADVLLSTTIIESGLDIPNANTIIIDRADRFGLSDLYQLRGRVGRYKHQAYAYLLLPRHAQLLVDVRKRISAIKQYSTLGSGFKIALRDLEIRGAGNLLGAEQTGHITAVGFELYCQLLKQSVSALKGEKIAPRVDVTMRLDFLALDPGEEVGVGPRELTLMEPGEDEGASHPSLPRSRGRTAAFIPFRYIGDARQRIEIYRKLAQASDKKAIEGLRAEIRDRFGPLPQPIQLLLRVAELRILAAGVQISAIETRDDKLMLTRNGDFVTVGGKFPRLTRQSAEPRLLEIKKLLLAL